MAAGPIAGTIDTTFVRLIDQWPAGANIPAPQRATGGTLGAAAGHNTSTAKYPLGTKFRVSADPLSAGLSTFVYLKMGTQAGAVALVAGSVVGLAAASDNATLSHFVVNGDPELQQITATTSHSGIGAAIAISAMTDLYYGWFWCGGPSPENFITALATTIATYTTASDGADAATITIPGILAVGDHVTADKMALVDMIGELANLTLITPMPFAMLSKAPTG
jgi:hypothetical protein